MRKRRKREKEEKFLKKWRSGKNGIKKKVQKEGGSREEIIPDASIGLTEKHTRRHAKKNDNDGEEVMDGEKRRITKETGRRGEQVMTRAPPHITYLHNQLSVIDAK